MDDREQIRRKAESFFNDLWLRGDPWELETSDWEHQRYSRLLALLDKPRYGRVLEIGCGAGTFTRRLAERADQVLALDVSSEAIARAKTAQCDLKQVEFRAGNIMDYNFRESEPWDLIVLSETIYFLGWLYSFFDVSWLASELFEATRPGGETLLANTQFETGEPLLRTPIIRTYRDLFLNVGYELTAETILAGEKHGAPLEVLISLFGKTKSTQAAR
ncbi:MAG TPA: SAM-dependent methyltransferase [Candidatus Binatia bacterium]|jgi:2-polyprenyl-3-methyl-5-hydroxy-6-metoxy-1,4-benzoquinol methylase